MAAHAVLSPSSASRWLHCAGSVAMCHGLEDSGSSFANEGTAAHFLGEQCLKNGTNAAIFIGMTVSVGEETHLYIQGDEVKGEHFKVSAEMAEFVQVYVDHARSCATTGELLVEQSLPLTGITGEADAFGTADSVCVLGDELVIIDLKYGRGVEVSAEENEQLMIYGLAALAEYEMLGDFERVRLVICQPRVSSAPSEWVISADDLRMWGKWVTERAYHAMQVLNNEKPEAYRHHLAASVDACRWCKAKATCPKIAESVTAALESEFTDLTTQCAVTRTETIADLIPLGPELLAQKMAAVDLIEMWCKAIRAAVESELLKGIAVPGYKLVQGRKGARAWNDADAAEALMKSMRLKVDEMYDFKLISPTTAEKVLADTPRKWSKVLPLISQSSGSPSVAPVTDKRPALSIQPVESEFETINP